VFLYLAIFTAAFVLLLLLLLARLPVTLSSNVQAKAEPSGAWAVACGLGLGPLALSAIFASGVKPFLTCHLFGRQVVRVPLARWARRRPKKIAPPTEAAAPETESVTPLSRFERGIAEFFRTLDPVEALLSWWDKERLFQVRSLIVEVDYSFRDVALTGRILAALYVLSAILPEGCEIRQTPSWESEDRVGLGVDGAFKIWPGRLLLSIARFVLKQRSRARASARLSKQATHST
jgi:hypothetical protein